MTLPKICYFLKALSCNAIPATLKKMGRGFARPKFPQNLPCIGALCLHPTTFLPRVIVSNYYHCEDNLFFPQNLLCIAVLCLHQEAFLARIIVSNYLHGKGAGA